MKLIVAALSLALFGVTATAAQAQGTSSPQLKPDWSDTYSEEQGAFECPYPYFWGAVQCSGDYCDNKRFKCKGPFSSGDNYWTGWHDRNASSPVACKDGYFIVGMECKNGGDYCSDIRLKCGPVNLPQGLKRNACDSRTTRKVTISDEGGSLDHQIELKDNLELFSAVRCKRKYCDDLEFEVCNPFSGDIPATSASWDVVANLTGGALKSTYTSGIQRSSESAWTKGASVSVSTGGNAGPVSVSGTVTASVEHSTSSATGYDNSSTIEYDCSTAAQRGRTVSLYVYALENEALDMTARGDQFRCHYSQTGNVPPPVCLPRECDDRFADNCQKCTQGAAPLAAAIGPAIKVDDQSLTKGSFVDFVGTWNWADGRAGIPSRLIFLNNPGNDAFYCYRGKCNRIKYSYSNRFNGTVLEFSTSANKAGSLFRMTSESGGELKGQFWAKSANVGRTPDATIEMQQIIR